LVAERAAQYNMDVVSYKRRNLSGTEVTSSYMAAVVTELIGERFSVTTAARIPVDSGNERVV
jgi:hypothetical protein